MLRNQEVLEHRQLLEWLRYLEGPPDPHQASPHRFGARDVGSRKGNAAAVHANVAGDEVEQCGFARAIRSDDAERFALGHIKGDIVGDTEGAEILGHLFDTEDRLHAPSLRQLDRRPDAKPGRRVSIIRKSAPSCHPSGCSALSGCR
jgi:hypothetical protein